MAPDSRFSIRVLRGMHVGASAEFSETERCVIGSDTTCNVALLDDGVMPVHCVLYWKDGLLFCDALQGTVRHGSARMEPGGTLHVQQGIPLQCGAAHMLIECLDEAADADNAGVIFGRVASDDGVEGWRAVAFRILAGLRAWSLGGKLRLAVLGVFLAVGVSGVAVAIATWGDDAQSDPRLLGEVEAWLHTISPPGSELRAVYDREARRFAIAGYVATDYQGELLKRSLRESRYMPRADFASAEGLVTSFVRLVQMEKLLCVAEYVGSGHIKCSNDIPNENTATRIRMLAKQVPGLTDIALHVAPVVALTQPQAPAAKPEPVAAEPAPLPRWDGPRLAGKLSVWIWKKDRFVLDWRGIKYRQGDLLEGMTIEKITVDEIFLSRNGTPYSIVVASQ